MITYSIIGILFITTIFLAYTEDYMTESQKTKALIGYALVMVLLATTKSIEYTADASSYELMFYNNTNRLTEIATEPTFIYLSRLVLAFGGTISVVFFIYAIVTIPYKLVSLQKMTTYIFTALMIYIPIYFELQDMVQIRSAAAATFLMASMLSRTKQDYFLSAVSFLCAILFHYSAIVFMPILLLGNHKLGKTTRVMVAILIPTLFILYLMKKDLFSLIPSALIEGKLDYYQRATEKGEWGEMMTLYKNAYFMVKCILLYLCLYFYDYLSEKNKLTPILVNNLIASILFLLSLSSIPVIATRVSDLYGITDCIVFTFLLYLIEPKYLARAAIAIISTYMFLYNLLFAEYFT